MTETHWHIIAWSLGFIYTIKYIPEILYHVKAKHIEGTSVSSMFYTVMICTVDTFVQAHFGNYGIMFACIGIVIGSFIIMILRFKKQESKHGFFYRIFLE